MNPNKIHKVNEQYLTEKIDEEVELEVKKGINLLNQIKKPIITFLGSHVGQKGDFNYDLAYKIGNELGKQGFAIMTGGGPGIMEAGNKGAKDANTTSIGITNYLIKGEAIEENYFTHKLDLKYMFVRRFILSIKSQALIIFPGGFGTFNEMFEFITIMQVNIVDKVPIILINKKFWEGLNKWMQTLPEQDMIKQEDLKLIRYADTFDEVMKILNN